MARKKIRYAAGGDMNVGEALVRPGVRVPWSESEDNPLSPNFIPLTERGEHAKARFWAMTNRRDKSSPVAGVFDE